MSRSEHDAHRAMKPKSYSEGYLDGARKYRDALQRKRDRDAYAAVCVWVSCIVVGFALGAWTTAARYFA